MKYFIPLVMILLLSVYLDNSPDLAVRLLSPMGESVLSGFEWIYKTLNQNGAVLITIPTDANPEIIDSLAADYGKR